MHRWILVILSLVSLAIISEIEATKNELDVSNELFFTSQKYKSSYSILDLAVGDEYIWAAHRGGAIRLDIDSKTSTHYTRADGLIDSYVRAVEIDHEGNVWFGTTSGLSRFDGSNWSHFTDSNGLTYNNVSSLSIGPQGEILVGTKEGVSVYDGARWNLYYKELYDSIGLHNDADTCLSGKDIEDIEMDRFNQIWIARDSAQMCVFDGERWRIFIQDSISVSARDLDLDSLGNLWMAGVGHYDLQNGVASLGPNGEWTTFDSPDSLLGDSTTLAIGENDEVWVGINDFYGSGINHFNGQTWQSYTADNGYSGTGVNAIEVGQDGKVWTGSNQIEVIENNSWDRYLAGPVTEDDYYDLLVDRSGNLWVGTQEQGVIKFDGQAWEQFRSEDGLLDDYVKAIFEDQEGGLWFATFESDNTFEGTGVSFYDGIDWTTYLPSPSGLLKRAVNDFAMTDDGSIWFAHLSSGISRKSEAGWEQYKPGENGVPEGTISTIYGQENMLWVAYYRYNIGQLEGGISSFNGEVWVHHEEEIPYTPATDLAVDANGNLVALSIEGINIFDGNEWSGLEIQDFAQEIVGTFPSNKLIIDKNGAIWIIGDEGLYQLQDETLQFFDEYNYGYSSRTGLIAYNPQDHSLWFPTGQFNSQHELSNTQIHSLDSNGRVFLPLVSN